MGRLLTVNELADICRTTPATVRYWQHKRTGPPSIKLGRRRLYDEGAVMAWITAHAESEA